MIYSPRSTLRAALFVIQIHPFTGQDGAKGPLPAGTLVRSVVSARGVVCRVWRFQASTDSGKSWIEARSFRAPIDEMQEFLTGDPAPATGEDVSTRKPGRPPSDNPRSKQLPSVRVTEEENALVEAAAAAKGERLVKFLRDAILRSARRVMKESAK